MKKLTLIAALALSGCSVMQPIANKSAAEVAKLVDNYCGEINGEIRSNIRTEVNDRLSNGNSIQINCKSEIATYE